MTTNQTREDWLNQAAELLFSLTLQDIADSNNITRHPFNLSVGAIVGNAKAIGCCFPRSRSEDGINEIFFTPTENDSAQILATMVHELIHALDDCQSGHKGAFAKMARQAGLEGKLTATHAGGALQDTILDIIDALGAIPHSRLDTSPVKKQGTRALLVECTSCQWRFRITRKHYDTMQTHNCQCCGNFDTLQLETK